jgi:hypothetical protein
MNARTQINNFLSLKVTLFCVGVASCGSSTPDTSQVDGSALDSNATDAATGTCTFVVQVVEGSVPTQPLMNATVSVSDMNGDGLQRVATDAMGRACVPTQGITAPYIVTASKSRYTVTTIMGLRAPPEGAIHLEPQRLETRSRQLVRVTLENVPAGASRYVVDALDADTLNMIGVNGSFLFFPHPGLPLTLNVFAYDTSGVVLNQVSQDLGPRDSLPESVTVRFGDPPAWRTGTVRITLPPRGIVPGARTLSANVLKYYRGLYGTASTYVGWAIERRGSNPISHVFSINTLDGPLAPDGMAFMFQPGTPNPNTLQVWAHTYEGETSFELPVVNALALHQRAGNFTLDYDSPGWTYALLQFRVDSSYQQALLQVILVDPGDAGTLNFSSPPGLTLRQIGLSTSDEVTGMLLRMHHDRPWSLVPEVTVQPEYEAALTTPETALLLPR